MSVFIPEAADRFPQLRRGRRGCSGPSTCWWRLRRAARA